VRVDLLRVLLLEAEDDLNGTNTALGAFNLERRRHRHCRQEPSKGGVATRRGAQEPSATPPLSPSICSPRTLRRVLVDMRLHVLLVNHVLGHTVLVDTHRRDNTERPAVDLHATVGHNDDDDLLPAVLAPRLGPCTGDQVGNW